MSAMFVLESADGLHMGDGYYYYGSPNDYKMVKRTLTDKPNYVGHDKWSTAETLEKFLVVYQPNELVGWLNGACNNL